MARSPRLDWRARARNAADEPESASRPPPAFEDCSTPTPSSLRPSGDDATPAHEPGHGPGLAAKLAPGSRLADRYRIVRFIAAGGMGEVYEAEDLVLRTEVALKTIRSEIAAQTRLMERFRREALLARRVTHPNVCRVFDVGQHHASGEADSDVTFLTMELLSGETLSHHLRARGPMSGDEALPLVDQMAAALAAAHDAGVVHRDFKAANVMLVPAPTSPAHFRVVVTDFGLAWAAGAGLNAITHSTDLVGTPAYVAPEQVEGGEVSAAADVYAFGVVLYEMMTGHLPFAGNTPLSTVLKRFREKPPSPRQYAPDLAPQWEAVILRCLERDPRNRFAGADQAVRALRGESTAAPRTRHRRRLFFTAGVAALAVTGAVPYLWSRRAMLRTGISSPVAPVTRRAVAVLGFKNLSGNPRHGWLSTAFSEMLAAELTAGSKLRTIPGENVARMKADLLLSDAESVGADTLARIHSHVGADAVLVGSYLVVGDGESAPLRLDLRLQDATGGETIASITETGTEARMLELVAEAGRRLRESLEGSPLSTAEAGALRSSLPASAEAARLYAEGLARLRSFDALAARSLLEQATQADPRYAPAHAALAEAWAALGYDAKAAEAARRAFEGATDVSREERLAIEGRFREANREWPRAVEVYRSLWTFFPDDLEHGLRLAGAQISAGQGRDARATLVALRKLPAPASEDPRIELTEAQASEALGDFKAEREQAAQAAAKASARGASLIVARARLGEASALRHLGQPHEATEAARAARQLYEAVGDRGGVALSLLFLSKALAAVGDEAGARQATERGLAIWRAIGDHHGMARQLNQLGNILEMQGDIDGARRRREEALALFREVGDTYGVAVATFNLANIEARAGDHEAARASYEAALAAFREVGNKDGVGAALTGVADEMKKRGDFPAAKRQYEEALATHRETGDVANQSVCRVNLGIMATLTADLHEARLQYEDALRLAEGAANKNLIAVALAGLGEVQLRQGDLAGARRRAEEALAIRVAIGHERGTAESRMFLADLALHEGRTRDAEAQLGDVPGVFRKVGAPELEAHARAIRARAFLAAGDVAAAQSEVRRARGLVGTVLPPEVRFTLAVTEGRVRAAAGDAMAAIESLAATAAEAREAGLKAYELEARLAQGEAEMHARRVDAGQARLREVESEATAKGLALLARQAAATRAAFRPRSPLATSR